MLISHRLNTVRDADHIVVLAALAVARRGIRIVTVTGISMAPTYRPGDRLLVRRASIRAVKAGQVVILERPGLGGVWADGSGRPGLELEWMIKRVAAAPGDRHPDSVPTATAREPVVPPGKLLVIGDNLSLSMDSRYLGYIPGERLLGIVVVALPSQTGRNPAGIDRSRGRRCRRSECLATRWRSAPGRTRTPYPALSDNGSDEGIGSDEPCGGHRGDGTHRHLPGASAG